MLELRPKCEQCGKALPPQSREARICSFECTFCEACAERVLANVCPNCGGGFAPRPIRSKALCVKYPPTTQELVKPAAASTIQAMRAQCEAIAPHER